jgi:PTH1 family peptidyl-tRNA hydrolase
LSEAAIQVLVGLGNPGPNYEGTRHNAGYRLVDEIARHCGGRFRAEPRFHGESARVHLPGHSLWLLKPTTLMNRSGASVAAFGRFYRLPLSTLLVAHDDLDLPAGVVRFKRGGGHGGHNGLRDLHAQLGGNDYCRLRLGIGHPGGARAVVDYVLSRPSAEDRMLLDEAIEAAIGQLPHLLAGDYGRVMNALHSRLPRPE